ncbi:MAG: transglycosylase domain-containing protein [Burkholderiales bacterium]|nr:transglycosylase domain-containing protein [Burkholderiales bacterium]
MIEPQTKTRIRQALLKARDTAVAQAVTAGALVRRHPWRTAFALPALLVAYVAVLYAFTPSIGDIRKQKQEAPTVVLSADGKELAVFKRANRDWVKLAEISPNVINALVATEDHRFYDHHGFDFKRTVVALANTLGGDRQGGSTITQQLARNLYPEEVGRDVTVTRKVKELITALKIEAVYSKNEILETYLNTVPFLYNAYGIEMAARTYFDKSAKKLDVVEAATLVGMLKGTSYYNPVLAPDRAVTRRNTVLAQMVKYGKLPKAQFEVLARKPLNIEFERQPEFGGPAPHLAQTIRRWLIDWADRRDFDIHADGLVVRTTIDSRMQAIANDAVTRQGKLLQAVADVEWGRAGGGFSTDPQGYVAQHGKVAPFSHLWSSQKGLLATLLRDTPHYRAARAEGLDDAAALAKLQADDEFIAAFKREKTRIQAGFMAVDPHTGHVKAWVGSRDYQDDKFDHVAQARRQPGSTFKPFVYGAAFEAGARPTDTYLDQPVEIRIDRNQVWRPTDIHGSTGEAMTLRDGLSKSKNTITVQVLQQVGPLRVAQLARAMGVRESPLQEVPSLALGTSPVTLRELVAGYATIANGGGYIEPIVVTRVEDRKGRVLEEWSAPPPQTALSADAAHTLIDVLRGAVDEGTAVGMRPRFGIPMQADLAGKTGTTQNNTDGWFMLMHPNLVAGAWMGFNDNRITMRSEYWGQGAHNALFIVGDFVQKSLQSKLVDVKAKFAVAKNSTKAAPKLWDPLVGRVNDWWSSMFGNPSTESAAVVQPTPMPPPLPLPKPSAPDVVVIPEPMRLPDPGVPLPPPPVTRAPPTAVLGAPPPRSPDAVIPAPPSAPPVYAPSERVVSEPAPTPIPRATMPRPEFVPRSEPAATQGEPRESVTPSQATGEARSKDTPILAPSIPSAATGNATSAGAD